MKTTEMNMENNISQNLNTTKSSYKNILKMIFVALFMAFGTMSASAHCDSYDGPVIKDAMKALKSNNVNLVLKWITPEQEKEITSLFKKTYALKSGDSEVYTIVEKHFFETLVRLHRETEGAPYTGLKPAGSTKQIIQLTDQAIADKDFPTLLEKLNNHIGKVLKVKYEKVAALDLDKNDSPEKGRKYVEAYVDFTHTIEALHDIIEHDGEKAAHKH